MSLLFAIACLFVSFCEAGPFDGHNRTRRGIGSCSDDYKYTVESYIADGRPCMTDCVNGHCMPTWTTCEPCVVGTKKAATYYTSRNRHQDHTKCLSRCGNYGEEYTWCVIDNKNRLWDFCNDDTEKRSISIQFTSRFGPCRTDCNKYGESYLWCWTWWGGMENWDFCDQTRITIEQARTVYGKECRDECKIRPGKNHFWCYDSSREAKMCAPPGEYIN